ncbi:hypothetical protein EMIHUDRAFT_60733, partial [Emiliania huxleyi CCMP1516]|uniref:Cyclin-like domain-containing protein n=2 Tax=Emiliania huxleyi TaxID=2903 RepID=A0A0D3KWG5_EMIH1
QEETLHLAVQYLDRFLSLVPLRRSKLQLVGVTCAWVAAKYEERLPPPLDDFVEATAAAFQRSDLVRMEGLILSTLRFNLSAVTPASFVRRFTALMPPSVLCRDESLLARYVLELALQDQRCLKYLPSALGAAALCL